MLIPGAVQTTYTRYLTIGQVGMPATETGWDISSRIAEDPTAVGIGFGLVVSQGTKHGDKSAILGTVSGGTVVGITASDKTLPQNAALFVDKYSDGDNMAVMVRGDIIVLAVGTVAAGGAVYFNSTTGQVGPSSISNAVLLAGASFLSAAPLAASNIMSVEVGQLAIVRLVALGSL